MCNKQCQPGALCAKCSLLEVIRFRFGAFRARFGRDPRPDEPLFFNPAARRPEKACVEEVRGQVRAAAAAMGVEVEPVLSLLNLTPKRNRSKPRQAQIGYPSRRRLTSAWQKFANDKRTQRAHNVTAAELEILSRAAMMGEVRASSDFLFMLEAIRKVSRH